MKTLLFFFLLLFSFSSYSQVNSNWAFGYNNILSRQEMYLTNSPTSAVGNRYVVMWGRDSSIINIRSWVVRIRGLRYDAPIESSYYLFPSLDDSGALHRANLFDVLDTTNRMAMRAWSLSSFLPIGTTTTNVAEGTNLYYTLARARGAISVGSGLSYSSTTGIMTNTAPDQTVTLSAGTGISATGTYPSFTLSNTAPDQTVVLNGNTGISTTGTYPVFTITNTQPDRTVVLTGGTGVSTSGTYPNFTITNSAPDQVVSLSAGTGIGVSGAYPAFTVTNSLPDRTVSFTNGTGINVTGTYPSFTVANTAPDQTVTISAGNGIRITGSYPTFTVAVDTPTINSNVTRPLSPAGSGGTFTVSTTQYARVSYPLTLTVTTPALSGSATANAIFEYQRPGQTWWNPGMALGNTQSVTVAVAFGISTPATMFVEGILPPNCLGRIRYVVSGTVPGTVSFGATISGVTTGGTEILSYN